ncbi:hypothetical protein M2139_001971 [Enterococcus sp. PF1-24]|uniref:hypothetical protein n=1 Tax=unclassified Enterococcus TaxID=2608891 RepID=UPI0024733A0C|nr:MULTISPECIES: hypothetical protein [unclassified Enterococcus]MDH6364970.1 hypothetical protein [Enterococcus sp. PFB1-1]MDH6402071.1 hypothetical protein [Enterococcus sp. PF1-24]
MKEMQSFLREDWLFFRYRINKKINGFFYFLRKIPGLKNLITADIFAAYEFKQAFAILATLVSFLMAFVKKILVLVFTVGLHILAVWRFDEGRNFSEAVQEFLPGSLMLWFMLVAIMGGFGNQFWAILPKEMIAFYQEFLLSKKHFILGQRFVEVWKQGLFYLPAALIYGAIIGKPLHMMIFIFFSYVTANFLFMLLGNSLQLAFVKKPAFRWLTGIIFYVITTAAVIACYWFLPDGINNQLLLQPLVLLLLILLSVVVFYLVWNYRRNQEYIDLAVSRSAFTYSKSETTKRNNAQYIGQGIKMQKHLTLTHNERVEKLSGNDYLNALLFSRYRGAFNQRLKYIGIGFAVTALIIVGVGILDGWQFLTEEITSRLMPSLFLIMYFLSFGKEIVQMIFVNCDVSMLYYPFYREPRTILKGFGYRLRQIFYYNSIIIVGIFGLFLLLHVANGFYLSLSFFAVLLLLLVSLTFLFSFHELFIYYLLQPFTDDLEVQNPAYKVIAGIFYGFAYGNMQIKTAGTIYLVIVSVVSLLYVAIGLVVIYRVAPKTFKIRH